MKSLNLGPDRTQKMEEIEVLIRLGAIFIDNR
ncbi:hypothetical protein SAMN05443635_11192 [Roseobacter denitrificans OCh 114]|nr:hypothetical protein SAMN05443635_11192 [Roseobacter denitrificans OCh 114]